MGFFAGFVRSSSSGLPVSRSNDFLNDQFNGFALTTSVLYITIQVHRTTRLEQRKAIREQVDQINWLASSAGAYDRRLAPDDATGRLEGRLARQDAQPDMKDILKHRWNQEVEKLARKAYQSRWEDVRETAVDGWNAVMRLVKKD